MDNENLLSSYIEKLSEAVILIKIESGSITVIDENTAAKTFFSRLKVTSFKDLIDSNENINSDEILDYIQQVKARGKETYFTHYLNNSSFRIYITPVDQTLFTLRFTSQNTREQTLDEYEYDEFQRLSKIAFWEFDVLRKKLFWSNQLKEIHELNADFEPEIDSAIDFFYGEKYKKLVEEKFTETIEKCIPYKLEAPIKTAKGNIKFVRSIGKPIVQGGQCVKVYGTLQDITDAVITKERFQHLADNVPGIVFRYRLYPDGKDELDYISEGSEEMWGYSTEEIKQDVNLIWKSILPEHVKHMQESIQQSAKTLENWKQEWQIRHTDGRILWHKGHGVPKKYNDGTVEWDTLVIDITNEKKSEIALKEAKEQFQDLIQSIEAIVWESSAKDFVFNYISPQVEKITGYTPEEWLKDKTFWQDHIHLHDRKRAVEYCMVQSQKGIDHQFEYRFKTKSGKFIWLKDFVTVVKEKGEPSRLKGIMLNISSRKEKEILFEQERQLNKELLKNIPIAFFLYNNNGNVIRWNQFLKNATGYSDEEISQMKAEDFFPERNKHLVQDYIHKILTNGKLSQLEAPIIRKDGSEIISDITGSKIIYDGEEAVLGVARDITETKKYQAQLRNKQKELQNILDSSLDIICTVDLDGNFLRINKASEKILGYTPEELLGKNLFDFLTEDSKEKTRQYQQRMFEGDISNHHQNIYVKKNGEEVTIYWSISYDPDKEVLNAVGKDATEILNANRLLKKQAKALQKKNEDLEQFTYVASHDLQEPLRMISAFLTQLEKNYGGKLDEKAQQYIEYAVDGANRLKQIILDLLQYSRAGISEEEPYNVDLNKIIEELEILFKKIIKEKKAKFSYPKLPIVKTYKAAARQVFQNLIENALRYHEKNEAPQIDLSVEEHNEYWKFGVHDKGIGIAPENHEKIFIIFKRLNSKKLFSGSGLGLAVSKKIVEDIGGTIWVESEVGEGSNFYFTIPKH